MTWSHKLQKNLPPYLNWTRKVEKRSKNYNVVICIPSSSNLSLSLILNNKYGDERFVVVSNEKPFKTFNNEEKGASVPLHSRHNQWMNNSLIFLFLLDIMPPIIIFDAKSNLLIKSQSWKLYNYNAKSMLVHYGIIDYWNGMSHLLSSGNTRKERKKLITTWLPVVMMVLGRLSKTLCTPYRQPTLRTN